MQKHRQKVQAVTTFIWSGCKSTLVQKLIRRVPDLKYVILCPLGSLVDKVWGGFEARTDASALGNTVNNETGEQEQSTAGIDFGKIQLLIVDEAYLCVFENILKLKRKMRENPEMKVVFLGCPYQCEQIVKERENSVWCRPISESLDDLFARMFPHRVVLRINKRSPNDSLKLSEIKRMLFEEKQSTGEVLRHMIDQKWVGGVLRSDEEIVRSGISHHISHTNVTAIRLNRLVHSTMYRQPYRHELHDGTHFLRRSIVSDLGRTFDVGQRCRIVSIEDAAMCLEFAGKSETFRLDGMDRRMTLDGHLTKKDKHLTYFLQPVGQYVIRAYNKGLVRNTRVSMVGLPTEENRNNCTFRNSDDGKDVLVKRSRVDEHSFRFPYAVTGSSSQGTTIEERYCIHGMGGRNVSPKLLWTALTRGVSLQNLYIGMRTEAEPTVSDFKRYTEMKLKAYLLSDKQTGRYDPTEGAYSLERMAEMCTGAYMRRCSGLCNKTCDNIMDLCDKDEAISFDRIDSNRGHVINNLRVVCLACNRHAGNRDANF